MIGRNLEPKRSAKILAKTFFKEMRKMNFADEDIINFSREIIENLKADYEMKKVIEDKREEKIVDLKVYRQN